METKHTDKNLLADGLKKMLVAVVCFFLGPTLTYISPSLQNKLMKYAALALGIILCLLALYLAFRGLKAILDSMFKKQ